jgi:hypothetical protein
LQAVRKYLETADGHFAMADLGVVEAVKGSGVVLSVEKAANRKALQRASSIAKLMQVLLDR